MRRLSLIAAAFASLGACASTSRIGEITSKEPPTAAPTPTAYMGTRKDLPKSMPSKQVEYGELLFDPDVPLRLLASHSIIENCKQQFLPDMPIVSQNETMVCVSYPDRLYDIAAIEYKAQLVSAGYAPKFGGEWTGKNAFCRNGEQVLIFWADEFMAVTTAVATSIYFGEDESAAMQPVVEGFRQLATGELRPPIAMTHTKTPMPEC